MTSFKQISRILAVLVIAIAANAYAADYFLKLGDIKGETKDRIIRCPDGSCVIDDLPSGDFTVTMCDAQGNPVTSSENVKLYVQFNPKEMSVAKSSSTPTRTTTTSTTGTVTGSDVVAPRDVATGQSTGKRQHKPIKITKEWNATTPKLAMKTPTGGDNNSVIRWTLEVRVDRIEMK